MRTVATGCLGANGKGVKGLVLVFNKLPDVCEDSAALPGLWVPGAGTDTPAGCDYGRALD